MKSLIHYIRMAFVIFLVFTALQIFSDFFFGANPRVLGAGYGPLSLKEFVDKIYRYFITASVISVVLTFFLYQDDKYKWLKKQQEKTHPLKDPILNKIIEDAKSGKTADDILKAQNEDSKIKNEENDDHK